MLRFHALRRVRAAADVRRLDKVAEFYLHEFPSSPQFMDLIRARLMRPLKVDYAVTLVTAERLDGGVMGFGLYDHFPDLGLSYLEYLVTSPSARGQGVGGGIYEAMRESLVYDGSEGLLFEVNPDDPGQDAAWLAAAQATLRFYERYDARPLEGVRFDYPPWSEEPILLVVHDDLGRGQPLQGAQLRAFFRRLYRVKYHAPADDPGARRILARVPDGPLRRRPLRYLRPPQQSDAPLLRLRVPLVEAVVSEKHRRHVVAERDYLERPLRLERILDALKQIPFVATRPAREFPERHLLAVHDKGMVRYLRDVCARLAPGEVLHPTVFPVRRRTPHPRGEPTHAGYYSLDSFTPLTSNAYEAARAAVDVALTAAERLRDGAADGVAYALTRPPGHHAERDLFGGFCYFNNAAVAAHRLSEQGRVAVLDVDFHHGNGAQHIFWEREDVLTVSVHGDPRTSYPYFTGFADERGAGPGEGFNVNHPLPEGVGDDEYMPVLRKACRRVAAHEPQALVVALGLDASKDDPSGSFRLTRKGFHRMGEEIAALGLPTLLVQEGGYNLRHLAGNVTSFLQGWAKGRQR